MTIILVLLASSYGAHSINSKAISPNADTIFYRIDTTIGDMEKTLWKQSHEFLAQKKRKLSKCKCYIIVDETYDSYTGRLLRKEKKNEATRKEKKILRYIHKYKPCKGDTGSFKYLVFALVYGNKRRVLRVKAIKRYENYKPFIVKTLKELQLKISFECALFDRGFYDGSLCEELKRNSIPFIIRSRISSTMKKIYGFSVKWKCYRNFEFGDSKAICDLVLGADYSLGKRTKWAFITNMEFDEWRNIRKIYRKRWNIENIFKATDGIQLIAQTNNPSTRLFCVCFSFLLYNAWQLKNKKGRNTLLNFVMIIFENLFEFIIRMQEHCIQFYRDRLRINIPLWDKIIGSL
jgi:hypothetical protein